MRNNQMIRESLHEGVSEIGLAKPSDVVRTVDGLTTLATTALSDLQERIQDHEDPKRIISGAAYICGTVLHAPGLKLPGGKIVSDQNAQLMREVVQKELDPDYHLDLTIALGGSEDAPSLRTPAYVGPALDITQAFMCVGFEAPAIRILGAYDISATLNGLNGVIAAKRAAQAHELIRQYASTHYPDTAAHLVAHDVTMGEMQDAGLEADAKVLLDLLTTDSVSLSPEEQNAQAMLLKLERAAQKHSNHDYDHKIIASYAAAHGISFRNFASLEADGVIKIGGQGEAPFDIIQAYMADVHADDDPTTLTNLDQNGKPRPISLRNKAGLIPPYYLESGAEITVETPTSDIPTTIEGLEQHYAQHGLRSGSDFQHLPAAVRAAFNPALLVKAQR